MSSYFWKQIKKNQPKQKLLKESYDTVTRRQYIKGLKQNCLEEEYELIAERVGLVRQVASQLAKVMPGWRPDVKHGAVRMQPVDLKNRPVLTDANVAAAADASGYKYIAKHPPAGLGSLGSDKNKSGRYPTYELEVDGLPVYVVFGTGGNEGNAYEQKANEEMALLKGEHPNLKPLLPLIAPDTIVEVISRSGNTRRKFNGEIQDIGPIIADTWVKGASGKTYYVSLKNKNGATISNHGCAGILKSWDTGGQLSFNPSAFPPLTHLLEALNVDINLLVDNLQQYLNAVQGREWNPSTTTEEKSNGDLGAYKQALMSSIGYGYYYVREKSGGKIQFEDLSTLEKLSDFIGEMKDVEIRYPYVKGLSLKQKRKGLDLIGHTTKGWKFIFQFRNANRGLIPKQLNLMISGNGIPEIKTEEA